MRLIDWISVKTAITDAWLEKADKKSTDLEELFDRLMAQLGDQPQTWEQLSKAVKDLAHVWQDHNLKQVFMGASFGKCWYCEARVAQRADNAIDHFRPKNRVAEDKTHHGYWWLACKWRNYRFACTFCNSARCTPDTTGGKQDHFPLWNEQKRVHLRSDSLAAEQPLLLDPTSAADMNFLTFDRTGKPVPRFSKEEHLYNHTRAAFSIRYYHLDRSELNNNRRDLMASMEEKLLSAELFARDLGGGNPTAEAAYVQAVAALTECIRPQAEFSSVARAFLSSKRANSCVALQLLEFAL